MLMLIANCTPWIVMKIAVIPISVLIFGSSLPLAQNWKTSDEGTGTEVSSNRCMKDCWSFSEMDGAVYPINCSLSVADLRVGQPETCDEVEREAQGTTSKAVHVRKDVEWYTFEEKNEMKLALNFSWRPGQDSSITSLLYYDVSVNPLDGNSVDLSSFQKCFSIHTQLHESRHRNAVFYYDCYGVEKNTDVTPGKSYFVSIQSKPGKAMESFKIDIPRCSDRRLSNVTYCVENKKPLSGVVEEVFCSNRTIKYSYNVPPAYGDSASVALCESWPNYYSYCKNVLVQFNGLQPYATLYNLSIDSSANLSIEYSVYVEGNNPVAWQNYSKVDFSVCPPPTLPLPAITIALTCVAMVVIIAVTALLVVYCACRDKILRRKSSGKLPDIVMLDTVGYQDVTDNVPLLRHGVTVYVVFNESDEHHIKVVHAFCRFLMADLGFKVITYLWEKNKAAQNSTRYMMENFQTAEKVLVICSEGMRDVLSSNDWQNMYSGVINQAVSQVFGKYQDKCLLAYFDYSSSHDVPKEFPASKKRYKLMAELNELYFALIDEEQVRHGKIFHISEIDNFYNPDKRTQVAVELLNAIERMKENIDKEA